MVTDAIFDSFVSGKVEREIEGRLGLNKEVTYFWHSLIIESTFAGKQKDHVSVMTFVGRDQTKQYCRQPTVLTQRPLLVYIHSAERRVTPVQQPKTGVWPVGDKAGADFAEIVVVAGRDSLQKVFLAPFHAMRGVSTALRSISIPGAGPSPRHIRATRLGKKQKEGGEKAGRSSTKSICSWFVLSQVTGMWFLSGVGVCD